MLQRSSKSQSETRLFLLGGCVPFCLSGDRGVPEEGNVLPVGCCAVPVLSPVRCISLLLYKALLCITNGG